MSCAWIMCVHVWARACATVCMCAYSLTLLLFFLAFWAWAAVMAKFNVTNFANGRRVCSGCRKQHRRITHGRSCCLDSVTPMAEVSKRTTATHTPGHTTHVSDVQRLPPEHKTTTALGYATMFFHLMWNNLLEPLAVRLLRVPRIAKHDRAVPTYGPGPGAQHT